jgi:hypothetical protein
MPMKRRSLPQQGLGNVKGSPEMKAALAKASEKVRMSLEARGVAPLMAQELVRAKMRTPQGQAKLMQEAMKY